jgi:hypothetical protein
MDDNNQAPNNVIQFPSAKKKEADEKSFVPQTPAPKAQAAVAAKPPGKARNVKAKTAGTVLAVILATGAVNRFTFNKKTGSADLASTSRAIASVEHTDWQRDAAWEKTLAESLAADQDRGVASLNLGHPATAEERLRWGTLEEKYTIVYKTDVHNIQTIMLQDSTTNPAYILDRNKFLNEYGRLLADEYASSKLISVEVSHDKTVESYTLFDKDQRPKGEAHFELDTHKRLLSLKVEDVKI